jgi:hypothetical protein
MYNKEIFYKPFIIDMDDFSVTFTFEERSVFDYDDFEIYTIHI